jgi:hypothetical protein
MVWKSNERLAARNYDDANERQAFRTGYSDGYHGYPRIDGNWYPNAYSAGYWEGVGDAKEATLPAAGPIDMDPPFSGV